MPEDFDDADIARMLAERSELIRVISMMLDWEPDEDYVVFSVICNKARTLLAKIKDGDKETGNAEQKP